MRSARRLISYSRARRCDIDTRDSAYAILAGLQRDVLSAARKSISSRASTAPATIGEGGWVDEIAGFVDGAECIAVLLNRAHEHIWDSLPLRPASPRPLALWMHHVTERYERGREIALELHHGTANLAVSVLIDRELVGAALYDRNIGNLSYFIDGYLDAMEHAATSLRRAISHQTHN